MQRRILFLITDLEIGGTPTVVRELTVRLIRLPGVSVEVACLSGWGPVADQLKACGVCVTALQARGITDIGVFPRLIAYIRSGRFDTVVSFLIHANMAAAIARSAVEGVRWIQSIQTTQPHPRWHWSLQRIAQLACEKVVVPSASVASAAQRWAGIGRRKLVVIPNAIDLNEWSQATPDIAGRFPIVFIGRLDPIKDVPTLVRAMAKLPGARLDIYGEGSDRPRIEAEISQLKLNDSIMLHGAIVRSQAVLQRAGMLILPSLAEGFGLVLIEAMASGVPVVATDVAGIRDVVRNGQTGLLCPARNPDALAAATQSIINDADLRQRLVTAARSDVAARFTWSKVLEQYCRLLQIPAHSGGDQPM